MQAWRMLITEEFNSDNEYRSLKKVKYRQIRESWQGIGDREWDVKDKLFDVMWTDDVMPNSLFHIMIQLDKVVSL